MTENKGCLKSKTETLFLGLVLTAEQRHIQYRQMSPVLSVDLHGIRSKTSSFRHGILKWLGMEWDEFRKKIRNCP